jgi:hypothetical protein
VIPFSGVHKSNYRLWKINGNKYGWAPALLTNYTHDGVTRIYLTDARIDERKLNGKAATHLVSSCTGKTFNTVTNAKVYQNAFELGLSFHKKYKADNDNNLVGLVGEFVTSRLETGKEDQKNGFQDWKS